MDKKKRGPSRGHRDVRVDQPAMRCRRPDDENREPEHKAGGQDRQRGLSKRARRESAREKQPEGGGKRHTEQRVGGDLDEIPNGRIGKGPQVRRVEEKREKAGNKPVAAAVHARTLPPF
jgi:hypothetical protein